jgi:hypothetical protein
MPRREPERQALRVLNSQAAQESMKGQRRFKRTHLHKSPFNKNKLSTDSENFQPVKKGVITSVYTHDGYMPCPSGYTRGQGWSLLNRAWLGFKIASDPRRNEGFLSRLNWAMVIQNIQTDLGIKRTSFPQLGLLGDYIFLYDSQKQEEMKEEHEELSKEEKRKRWEEKLAKRAHIREIVHSSFLSDTERTYLKDTFTDTGSGGEGFVEKIVLVDTLQLQARHNQSEMISE